jgi:hypothetical protein
LQKISKQYGIALDVLLFGEEPHMRSYFLTRKGKGMSVERRKGIQIPEFGERFPRTQGRPVHRAR